MRDRLKVEKNTNHRSVLECQCEVIYATVFHISLSRTGDLVKYAQSGSGLRSGKVEKVCSGGAV